MSDWSYFFGYLFAGAMLAMMAIGIAFSLFMPALDKWNKRYFTVLFSLLFLCTVSCLFAVIFWEDPTKATQARIVYLFEGLLLSTPVFMPTLFLLHTCGESPGKSPLFGTVAVLQGLYVILLIASQFMDAVYRVTQDNQFIRGPMWWVWIMPLVLIMLFNIAGVSARRKKLSKKYRFALLVYLLPMTAAIILHMFISVELFVVFGMALFAMIMFGLILSEQIEQHARQQQEIANQKMSVMVLQMRPHFIYNTLMSIYSLCAQDPDKARQVTMDFTNYLRKNFNAVGSDDLIPFSAELEHTRAYLAVEQAQHEEMLKVAFDTPFTQFRLPPLTLQPLAENAVKHGLDPYAGPLSVSIRTERTEDGVSITVEDNGRGFDPHDKTKPHPALDNIESRIKQQCGGTLAIASKPGCTTVTIFIPLKG